MVSHDDPLWEEEKFSCPIYEGRGRLFVAHAETVSKITNQGEGIFSGQLSHTSVPPHSFPIITPITSLRDFPEIARLRHQSRQRL